MKRCSPGTLDGLALAIREAMGPRGNHVGMFRMTDTYLAVLADLGKQLCRERPRWESPIVRRPTAATRADRTSAHLPR